LCDAFQSRAKLSHVLNAVLKGWPLVDRLPVKRGTDEIFL
jgi:hypothetical protein